MLRPFFLARRIVKIRLCEKTASPHLAQNLTVWWVKNDSSQVGLVSPTRRDITLGYASLTQPTNYYSNKKSLSTHQRGEESLDSRDKGCGVRGLAWGGWTKRGNAVREDGSAARLGGELCSANPAYKLFYGSEKDAVPFSPYINFQLGNGDVGMFLAFSSHISASFKSFFRKNSSAF